MNYKRFPFGKYKGEPLSEIPNTYIVYALESFDLPDELVYALQEVLCRNLRIRQSGISRATLISAHRELSMVFHPDRGGSDEAMKAINVFRDMLIEGCYGGV